MVPSDPGGELARIRLGLATAGLNRATIAKILVGLVAIVGVVAAVASVLREPITRWSASAVHDLGLSGIFAAVFAMDPVPGLGFQPALFLGYTGGIALVPLVAAAWAASMLSSITVYGVGRRLRESARLLAVLERYRIATWLRDHGVTTIAIAAIGPLPYGLATLGAGVVGVRFRHLLFGALFRGVKIAATAGAIGLGWGLG
jgi:hypothetical protein